MIGRTLAHYEITGLLGKGGMGEVYRARDKRLDRDVALKVLPESLASDPVQLERFEREAKAVAGLNHPHVVVLHSVEEDAGIRFLTMELVEGQGLDRAIPPGGLPLRQVCEFGAAIADALSAAHARGIVHRDLKPANVMVGHDGRIRVLDFGLAKIAAGSPPAAPDATRAMDLTRDGAIAGTIPYMSPEQVRGQPLGPRSDLFSLGVVLYEMATGSRPFAGPSNADLISSILKDTPPALTELNPDLPAQLSRIVERCLAKNPEDRYASAVELRDALREPPSTPEASGESVSRILLLPPVPSTPLIGREDTLDAALAQLRGRTRLLTVTGYGGTGKTRFAIELFRRLADEYPAGAAFVSLASVTSADEVAGTIATALEIPEAHGRTALEALATVIGNRRMLLVLDNLEQVLEAAGDIAALVSRCEALQCIATSRAPLKVGAETEFVLPPLDLPAPGARALEDLTVCPAVQLFVQRASRVKPGFALDTANAPVVTEICRRLDGLPLALELAAARVRILEPGALLQRLDHALDLLTSGDRDLPLRQKTLRATISWSYSLLDPAEQRLMRQLSCFCEGWTLDAMEQVCFGDDERHLALDQLDSLVEKGLVRVVGSGERYALLETIRAFSAEQLHASGEVEAVRRAHAQHFLDFARTVQAGIGTAEQVEILRRARREDANLHAALQWLLSWARAGDADSLEKALLICGHLNWYWHISGQHLTARTSLDELLGMAAAGPSTRGRALAWLTAGMVSTTTGELERSLREWDAGFADAEVVGDREAAAEGRMGVGYCNLGLGRMAEAEVALADAIERSRGRSDFMHALSLTLMGMLAFLTGKLDEGLDLVHQARHIQERIADHEGGGVALSFLAQMTFAQGDPVRALELYGRARAAFEAIGDHPEIARVHCEMGWTSLAASDTAGAMRSFRRAVLAYQGVGSPRGTGLAILGIAAVEAAEGRAERAVAVAAAAQALSERAGVVVDHPMDPGLAQRIEALKAAIPTRALEDLVARSSALTPAEVLEMVAA